MSPVLIGSIALSALYGLFFCNRSPSLIRVLIKTGATALLTLWAYLAGGPTLLVAALAFSTLGDAFLGASEERFLLPGMGAFFIAHVAYIAAFWGHIAGDRTILILIAQVALTFGAAAFIRSLVPWIDKPMRLPVIGYAVIIAVMGNAALRLTPDLWLATAGALAFMASDLILSFELFRLPPDHPARPITSRFIWTLYYGGQALIAYALIQTAI